MSCCPTDLGAFNTYTAPSNSSWSETLQGHFYPAEGAVQSLVQAATITNVYGPNAGHLGPIFLPGDEVWTIVAGSFGGTNDQPDGGPVLGAVSLALTQLVIGAASTEAKEILLESHVVKNGQTLSFDPNETTNYTNRYNLRAIDYNPVDDLIYFGLDPQFGVTVEPGLFADSSTPISPQLWYTDTSGAHGVLYTGSAGRAMNTVDAASDGAVWFTTSVAEFAPASPAIFRKPLGSSTPIQLTLTGDWVDGMTISGRPFATPWGAMLFPVSLTGFYFNRYLEVKTDGRTKLWPCADLHGGQSGPMRTLDFSRSYYTSGSHLYLMDWKGCGAGWVVGGMAVNG